MAEKFKEFLKFEKKRTQLAALLICGGVLMLIGSVGVFSERDVTVDEVTLEERTVQLCSLIDGVGECEIMITYAEGDSVYAVAVLCEGAEDIEVKKSVTELITSLFGISTNRISILKISK